MKPFAFIVDLDGTLSDSSKRKHYVEGAEKKNWEAFYSEAKNDEANRWCSELVKAMDGRARPIFLTGRPEKYREETVNWLESRGFHGSLYMREDGNFEPDWKLKERIYFVQIEPRYEVLFCIDDRKQVVEMWRRLGLTCLHCAEGEF